MLTATQRKILDTELAKPAYAAELAAKHYQAVADALNVRPEIPNPTPQPTRPKLISWVAFLDALTNADTLKLYTYPGLAADLRAALGANDRTSTIAIWKGLRTALTAGSVTAVEALANSSELDPTWAATIQQPSIAQGLELPAILLEDVQRYAARVLGA